MEDSLKNSWKKVGKDFASLGKDLGKSLAKSVRKGVNAATEWSKDENVVEEAPAEEKK